MKKLLLFSYLALIIITQSICASNAVPECHYALMSAKDILVIIQNFKPNFANITIMTHIVQNGNIVKSLHIICRLFAFINLSKDLNETIIIAAFFVYTNH